MKKIEDHHRVWSYGHALLGLIREKRGAHLAISHWRQAKQQRTICGSCVTDAILSRKTPY